MEIPRVLLLSSSKVHGQGFFEWCSDVINNFFIKSNVKKVLFVPYAMRDYDGYATLFSEALEKQGYTVESIHVQEDPVSAVLHSEAIFVGGGNTFLLLKTLYEKNLIEAIREAVFKKGIPYVGSSAGSNVATRSINTTNDMPICLPPSFEALKLVPFNINPHYLDADVNSTHMGETREKRIQEYLLEPECAPVLGLREGSGVLVEGNRMTSFGFKNSILFKKKNEPVEYVPGSDLSFLLKDTCS